MRDESDMENENVTNPSGASADSPAAPGPENGVESTADVSAMQKELEEVKTKAAENLDGWQRERAAFTNYKKRVERDQAETAQMATARVINRYLDILDDFERALKDKPAEGELAKWSEGILLIYRKLQNVLEAEGVARIEAEGKAFDPKWHEAVVHEESSEHPSGQIVEVLRQGYKIGDRVIRPSLVKVAR